MDAIWIWAGFIVFVLAMLALDLGVFHREAHRVSAREAGIWSAVWITLALLFNYGVYHFMGRDAGLEFLAGYLIEKALSVDNIFVFVLIFSYFRVPAIYQHRILFWGILGALVMRGLMIGAGAYLITRFHWIIYIFGAFLVYSGIRMAFEKEADIDPESNPVIRLVRRFIPVTTDYHGQRFFVKEAWRNGDRLRRVATPLFVVLVLVETTDLIFAVDSIPAVFGVTTDPFIVFSSNVFAILGLRALYFLLAQVIERFHYLKIGLSLVLVLVGAKMLISELYKVPIGLSLGIIAVVLGLSVAASLLFPKEAEAHADARPDPLDPDAAPDLPGGGVSSLGARDALVGEPEAED
ncbi:MAG TPA: TerC family protein [Rhodothermales bacterium]|nr:TerC family protein [Rhodothermales bacterium]